MIGTLLWLGLTATGAVGFARHCWRTRRRPTLPTPTRQAHSVTRVPGRSLALDAYTSRATGRPFDWATEAAWLADGPEPAPTVHGGDVVEAAELILKRAASRRIHPSNVDGTA